MPKTKKEKTYDPGDAEKGENCLAGWRCPRCKSYGPFAVTIKATVIMDDDGFDVEGDTEFEDDSFARCENCELAGTVKDFKDPDHAAE